MAIAKSLSAKIRRLKKSERAIINLVGDLGSGKTTFIKGFARGLGIKSKIISPTFLIIRKLDIRRSKIRKTLYHIDAYRVAPKDIMKIGFDDIINGPDNIVLIEWGDRLKRILPKQTIKISLSYGKKENIREININI